MADDERKLSERVEELEIEVARIREEMRAALANLTRENFNDTFLRELERK